MTDAYDSETGVVLSGPQQLSAPRREMNLIFASPECGEVFGALCDMQGTMEAPKRTKSAAVRGKTRDGRDYEYKYTYAPLEEIVSAIKAPMKDAGLAYRQFLAMRDGAWVMRTIIAHRSGQWFGADYPIYFDESKGAQGFASGTTYARRYGLMLALGLAAEDDDDANVADGNVAKIDPTRRREVRPAPEANSGYPSLNGVTDPTASPEAPADPKAEAKAEANKRWREIVAMIEREVTNKGLDQILKMPAWNAFDAIVHEAESKEHADEVVKKLRDRVELRRGYIARIAETP